MWFLAADPTQIVQSGPWVAVGSLIAALTLLGTTALSRHSQSSKSGTVQDATTKATLDAVSDPFTEYLRAQTANHERERAEWQTERDRMIRKIARLEADLRRADDE